LGIAITTIIRIVQAKKSCGKSVLVDQNKILILMIQAVFQALIYKKDIILMLMQWLVSNEKYPISNHLYCNVPMKDGHDMDRPS
jgi:hypothetical protein